MDGIKTYTLNGTSNGYISPIDREGKYLITSVISYNKDGKRWVGNTALRIEGDDGVWTTLVNPFNAYTFKVLTKALDEWWEEEPW